MSANDERTDFDYLLNQLESAASNPVPLRYADKRAALFRHVRWLEKEAQAMAAIRDALRERRP